MFAEFDTYNMDIILQIFNAIESNVTEFGLVWTF